ncbi:MAG: threonylcarbamoyl-AMP synthase [Candidatus Auribacter fodinae]|jgi:L-threonylcarbamoyladenylate synthase|uniref:L-threonylcarbamoyladenylate synthase n=1 Tax=Candidatus Auribacter fodinae TaxID=2093366 RepID=A0A3A4QWC8_9BACT|nr:MAG: threonylcarbamoyl-AMP synthase [Candidatus Auribacter fodinae]
MQHSSRLMSIDPRHPQQNVLDQAAEALKQGGLVIFPTETVYGIAAIHGNKTATEKLVKIKDRDANKPFTLHICDMDTIIKAGCVIPPAAQKLMDKYWPGPLTLLLPLKNKTGKLGFRYPDHPVAIGLIKAVGTALIAPSANRKGEKSPVNALETLIALGDEVDIILDAGATGYGRESTILDLSGEKTQLIREGAISFDEIQNFLKNEVIVDK